MNKRIYKGYRYAANLILQTDNDQDAIDCLVAAGYSDERIARHTHTLINKLNRYVAAGVSESSSTP